MNVTHIGKDIISEKYEGYNRGRVFPTIMDEIGFEDCDYIALEFKWVNWIDIAAMWPLQLNVPCREPLEHLMSQCNYQNISFDCNATDLHLGVEKCLIGMSRFHLKMTQLQNVTMKCFNPIPVKPYLELMDQFLQRKRIEIPYVHRDSNKPRHKDDECIWENPDVADRVLKILHSFDYYKWCKECIGSENDLLRVPRY